MDHQRCFLRAIEEADTDLWNRTLSSLGKRPFPDLSCKPTLLKTALKKCVEKEGAARFLARARDTCREPDARALIDNVLFALKADETSDADL